MLAVFAKCVRKYWVGYLLLLPATCFVFFISIYPIIYAIDWSLYSTQYLQKLSFAGLSNYYEFIGSPRGMHAFLTTLIYCFGSLAISVPLSMAVASLLDRPVRGRIVFRAIILIPWVLSQTVVALLWKWLLDPYYGPINYVLQTLGVGKVGFLSSPLLALPTLIFVNVWMSYPLGVVLILAALQTVPRELIDAAVIDGASTWLAYRYIKFPHIKHTVLVVLILQTLLYFNMVTLIYVSTGGGPLGATETISIHLFKSAFENWKIGYASSVGVIMLVFNLLFSLSYVKALRREA